ncbi:hypothetical protein SS50377_20413 [Spironucleus salmonicida]|uniref:Uncharacterized protein n=1 Tax=Spironucleus salmonicida TaxID=348837 RepID=V6LXN0_9EUKA|nr:hypothetical protein SS50377_20413 [Spironucleus salmonicida]|eukprot:EST45574.1 Hypothetical protein SS50377_14415 [Spironucleus salmonicida]
MQPSIYFKTKAQTLMKSRDAHITQHTLTSTSIIQRRPAPPKPTKADALRATSNRRKIARLNRPLSPEFEHKKTGSAQLQRTAQRLFAFQEVYARRRQAPQTPTFRPQTNQTAAASRYLQERPTVISAPPRPVPDEVVVQSACQRQYQLALARQSALRQREADFLDVPDFHPKIDENSQKLVRTNFDERYESSVERFRGARNRALEALVEGEAEVQSCAGGDPLVFQKLYVAGMERLGRIQRLYDENMAMQEQSIVIPSFEPQINENARQLSSQKAYRMFNEKFHENGGEEDGYDVGEQKFQAKLKKQQKDVHYDQFMTNFYEKNMDFVGEKQRKINLKISREMQLSSSKFISSESEVIAQQKLDKKLTTIFSQLQNEGMVSVKQLRKVDNLKCAKCIKKCVSNLIIENGDMGMEQFVQELGISVKKVDKFGEMVYSESVQ